MPEDRFRQQDEKDEKLEKKDEKEEKSWDEKWRRDPLNAAAWAIIVIWAGLVLLAANFGLFQGSFLDAWPAFFLGASLILLLEIGFRLLVPAYRQPIAGTFVLAVVLMLIGLGGILRGRLNLWPVISAVALIAVGGYILLHGLFRKRE